MATYRKRGDSWRVEVCVDGKRDSATFDTKKEAEKWADERATELRKRSPGKESIPELAQATLGALLDNVIKNKTILARTRRSREAEEYRIEAMKEREPCSKVVLELTGSDFIEYKAARERAGIASSTIRRELGIVRAALAPLVAKGVFPSNPVCEAIKALPQDPEVERLLSEQEVREFEHAHEVRNRNRNKNPWLLLAFLFAQETGLRKAELIALDWADIDLTARTAFIWKVDDIPDDFGQTTTRGTKNGKTRKIPLSPQALEILEATPRSINSKLKSRVFPISYSALGSGFQRLRRRSGIHCRWHDLRHMAATSMLKRLRNIAHVAIVTGHEDWESLRRYTHPRAEDIAVMLAEQEK